MKKPPKTKKSKTRKPPNRTFNLTGRVAELAAYMAARRGQVLFLPELLVNVFGHPADSQSRTVDTHIYRLTMVVGETEEIFSVHSRRRRGYMLARSPGGEP